MSNGKFKSYTKLRCPFCGNVWPADDEREATDIGDEDGPATITCPVVECQYEFDVHTEVVAIFTSPPRI